MITEDILQIDEKGLENVSKKELLEILSLTERWSTEKDCKFYLYSPYDVPKMFHASKAYTRAMFGGNRELCLDTLVRMGDGSAKKIEEIQVGDIVMSWNGDNSIPATITSLSPIVEKECVKYITKAGLEISCSADHPFPFVLSRRQKDAKQFIKGNVYNVIKSNWKLKRFLSSGLQNYTNCVSTIPFTGLLLGLYLGDGSYTRGKNQKGINFTNTDDYTMKLFFEEFIKSYPEENVSTYPSDKTRCYISNSMNNKFSDDLDKLGLGFKHAKDKFIPDCYKHSISSIRADIIKGLILTDGSVAQEVRIYSTSFKMLEDINDILMSFGLHGNINEDHENRRVSTWNKAYRIQFSLNCLTVMGIKGLGRKTPKQTIEKDYTDKHLILDKIEYLGKQKCRCLTIDNPTHIFVLANSILTYNSSKTYSHIEDYALQFVGEAPKALEGLIPEHRLDQKRRLRFCMEDYPNAFAKVVYPYIQQLVPSDKISDVVKDSGRIRAITNAKGGFIEFMYYDQETMKHAGSSRHSIGYDEQPPEAIREQGLMRLADVDGEETFSLTPEAGAMHYLYDDIYLKRGREIEKEYNLIFNEKGVIVDAVEGALIERTIPGGDPDIDVFFACIFDNKSIKKSAAIRILSKFTKDEVILRAKGHFIFLGGLVYKAYNDFVHLIDPFTDWWEGKNANDYTLYIAIDPHPRAPHAVLFLCVRSDGLHFIVDEIYSDCTAPKLVEKIKEKCHGKVPEYVIIDPLASTPDPSTKSCLRLDLIDFGLDNPYPIPASKDKSRGIIRCGKRLQVVKKTETDKGVPGIYVTANCTRFRYEITRYSWDEWKVDKSNTKGDKQKPVDKDDHMMENWYRLENLDPQWTDQTSWIDEDIYESLTTGRNKVTGY